MSELVCPTCGLPKNLCICSDISKEQQKIRIRIEKGKFRKFLTIVTGIQEKQKAKELEKILKQKLACGGTLRDKDIVLQGNHKERVKTLLLKEGYKQELIEG